MKNNLDTYYTPISLADKLVDYTPISEVKTTIDFCVGDGALLEAVSRKNSRIQMYGIDISESAIISLKRKHPSWHLSICDFCDEVKRNSIYFLRNKKFDLVLLNPPFSCRGSIVEHLLFEGQEYTMSKAMSFLVRTLRYLSKNGGVYAIMPISCVYSEKDADVWHYLVEHYHACVLEEMNRVYFYPQCSPNVAIIYVGKKELNIDFDTKCYMETFDGSFKNIIRGQLSMQNLNLTQMTSNPYLIHTTNIRDGRLVHLNHINLSNSSIKVNGVVFPRVCNPVRPKLAVIDECKSYVLSDCVIVIVTNTHEDAIKLYNFMRDHWDFIKQIYKGTGAQYTTLKRVREMLSMLHAKSD